MSFFSLFRKGSDPLLMKRPRGGKSDLEQQLEFALIKKREAEKKAAELRRQIDEVPKKLKKMEEEEMRRIRDRAARTPTILGLNRPVRKLHASPHGMKLTRVQQRMLLNKFFILCIVLAGMLFFLWKAVR